jgi:hypothetical protein
MCRVLRALAVLLGLPYCVLSAAVPAAADSMKCGRPITEAHDSSSGGLERYGIHGLHIEAATERLFRSGSISTLDFRVFVSLCRWPAWSIGFGEAFAWGARLAAGTPFQPGRGEPDALIVLFGADVQRRFRMAGLVHPLISLSVGSADAQHVYGYALYGGIDKSTVSSAWYAAPAAGLEVNFFKYLRADMRLGYRFSGAFSSTPGLDPHTLRGSFVMLTVAVGDL